MGKKIAVTGGSGGAGQYVVRELLEQGYEVTNLDLEPMPERLCHTVQVNLTDHAEVRDALSGHDAVVALAGNPEPDFDFDTGAERFRNNTLCNYNVFNAACAHGMEKVVWASSETTLGFPFDGNQPLSVPVDESHPPQPQNSYAISKVLCENAAVWLNQLHGVPFLGLRLSNVLFRGTSHSANYAAIPSYWSDPFSRKFNLWGYIDARDAARAARMALESNVTGAEVYNIAAADTIMRQTNTELMAAVFPDVPLAEHLGDHDTLLDIRKARRDFGWTPHWSWRSIVE